MKTSRIPDFANKSREGMTRWFDEMALRGLLFHPEDRPRDIITIKTGSAHSRVVSAPSWTAS